MVKIQKTNKIKTRNCRPWRLANGATNEVVRRDLALRGYDNFLCKGKCGGQIAPFVVCRVPLAEKKGSPLAHSGRNRLHTRLVAGVPMRCIWRWCGTAPATGRYATAKNHPH